MTAPTADPAAINRTLGAWTAEVVVRHPELGMPVERALLQRVQQVLAEAADAQGYALVQAQGKCQTLAQVVQGLLETTR